MLISDLLRTQDSLLVESLWIPAGVIVPDSCQMPLFLILFLVPALVDSAAKSTLVTFTSDTCPLFVEMRTRIHGTPLTVASL